MVYGGAALLTIITGADYLIVGIRQIVAVDKRENQEKRDKKVASKPNSDIPSAS